MALIPAFFSDCVVAVGLPGEEGNSPAWIASAFFYGHPLEVDSESGLLQYAVYLVSNRHVFAGRQAVVVRANPPPEAEGHPAQDFPVNLGTVVDGEWHDAWFGHPDPEVDIAVARVNFNVLLQAGMQVSFFPGDQVALRTADLTERGVTEGDFVFVLGFPMALVGEHRSVAVVRGGVIARVRDVLADTEKSFLVDATVFPGNSGGPVVLKPEVVALSGTQGTAEASLIGIVRAYVPYQDVAVSAQTQRPRVIFEENSGLAAVHPVDAIVEAIETDPSLSQVSLVPAPTAPPPEGAESPSEASEETDSD